MSDKTSSLFPALGPSSNAPADSMTHVDGAPSSAPPSSATPSSATPSAAGKDATVPHAQAPDSAMATRLDQARPASTHAFREPKRFGDYELLSEIARGGMGVVYRARQTKLDRVVALKMILGGKLADPEDVKRFHTEATAAGNLSHPNIVAVYEVGELEGQHFFSMEFVEGCSLAQKLAEGPIPAKTAARYVKAVARAVHHAHRHGILHRDLKPSNIMLDADDEPHVTDFGLAKRLGDSGQTRSGAVLGTPSYMAPEQAGGRTRELSPATDVYGLGAILYELLTGRPPFRSDSPMDTLMQVLENEPVPPALINPNVDTDLETICLKCLEKDPAARYPSAEAVADDLNRYINGEVISARTFNVIDRLVRTLDRSAHDVAFHTWSTMILGIAAIVFLGHVLVFTLIQTGQSRQVILLGKMTQFIAIGYLFWTNRGSRLLPTSPPERELWTIWIGYLTAYGMGLGVTRALVSYGIITAGPDAPQGWEQLMLYPFSAIISGLAFFIMGANYWGRFYAFGATFFLLALLMPIRLDLSPLAFGMLWSGVLLATGLHLRHVGKKAEAEKTVLVTPAKQTQT